MTARDDGNHCHYENGHNRDDKFRSNFHCFGSFPSERSVNESDMRRADTPTQNDETNSPRGILGQLKFTLPKMVYLTWRTDGEPSTVNDHCQESE
jgi:hypothetical protein